MPASRGTIFDRNGEPLAIGEARDDRLCQSAPGRRRTGSDARGGRSSSASILPILYPTLVDRSRGFVYVARKADPRKAKNLEALDFAGLGFYPEELRYYPQGPVAAQVLGYAGLDNKGLEGLERSLEGALAGKPGSQTIVKDPFGRALDVVETKPESPGTERPPDDRPRDPGERGGGAPGHGSPLGRASGDGGRASIRAPARCSRWRRHRASTPTASRRPVPTAAATAPSPTRTSRARPSSS